MENQEQTEEGVGYIWDKDRQGELLSRVQEKLNATAQESLDTAKRIGPSLPAEFHTTDTVYSTVDQEIVNDSENTKRRRIIGPAIVPPPGFDARQIGQVEDGAVGPLPEGHIGKYDLVASSM